MKGACEVCGAPRRTVYESARGRSSAFADGEKRKHRLPAILGIAVLALLLLASILAGLGFDLGRLFGIYTAEISQPTVSMYSARVAPTQPGSALWERQELLIEK